MAKTIIDLNMLISSLIMQIYAWNQNIFTFSLSAHLAGHFDVLHNPLALLWLLTYILTFRCDLDLLDGSLIIESSRYPSLDYTPAKFC